MARNDGTTAPMMVGMVNVNCPACGSLLDVDVLVESVSTKGGSYLTVNFQQERVQHQCVGRRS